MHGAPAHVAGRNRRLLSRDEHATMVYSQRVDRDAHRRVIGADAGREVELPPVPGTTKHSSTLELVATGRSGKTFADVPEAKWATVVRAAVPYRARPFGGSYHADCTAADPREEVSVLLEPLERTDVVPGRGVFSNPGTQAASPYAGTRPSRAP